MSLLELWVMLESGLPVYHEVLSDTKTTSISKDLFSGFTTVLLSFSNSLGIGDVEKLRMNNTNLYFVKRPTIIVVAITDKKSKSVEVLKKLKIIGDRFAYYFPADKLELLDTDDPTFKLFSLDVSNTIRGESKQSTKDINDEVLLIRKFFRQALLGQITIDSAVNEVKKLIKQEHLTNKEKDLLRSNLEDILTIAEKIGLDQATIENIKKIQEELSTWLSKTKVFLEKGW